MTKNASRKKSRSGRRIYSDELKAEAVQMLLDGYSAESVVSNLGLSGASLLYRWKANTPEQILVGGRGLAHAEELSLGGDQLREMLDVAEGALCDANRYGSAGTELPKCMVDLSRYERLEVGRDQFLRGRPVRACTNVQSFARAAAARRPTSSAARSTPPIRC